ncbi:hypothetical protein ACWT_2237 [Actinoplanes sp. SE50]|uniref:DedA family protein n=1 Tax=unclassified Actinoplanes TaxID=2626549 RepID=UPI00023ECE4D|nr:MULTISPECIES: DedA family protein [unclassified Actinoplanes]AEV83259.1 putative membrane protein [Actinoplanes sp. SE50/110]ATO81652.1 hypothetical protein ACWT_2237 [Actinoplanes sp. SE50]SLL99060.1 hypothetical protein ACSP50_2288 [Actinoplanes sp. SE50/110]
MGWLGEWLGGLPPVLVYAVVGALVAGEAAIIAGMVLPSATALIATGLLANAGVVPVLPALLVAIGAALLGGTVAYRRAARTTGATPPARTGRHWARAERLFARYGGRAIFLGQWVVGARTLMPRLAGRNGVPYRRFALWHTPSAILWALWMVGASYLAGAGYQALAARAGRAAGALAALTLIIVGLLLVGRWLGRHPFPVHAPGRLSLIRRTVARWHPAVLAAVSLALFTGLALVLIEVIPPIVRFSGLAAADDSVTTWARGQWTSDGYWFALSTAGTLAPEVPLTFAVVVALIRFAWRRRPDGLRHGLLPAVMYLAELPSRARSLRRPRGPEPGASQPGASQPGGSPPGVSRPGGLRARGLLRGSFWAALFEAVGPVLPAIVLAVALSLLLDPGWRTAGTIVFPSPTEFDGGGLPLDTAPSILAGMAAGSTAQTAAAIGLLAWLLTDNLRWGWQVTVWTVAAGTLTTAAGCWVYLGWGRLSETVAAVVIGAAWAALNAAIWTARYRSAERPVLDEADQVALAVPDEGLDLLGADRPE